MLLKILYIGLGGFIGSILRYLTYYFSSYFNIKSYLTTLTVNSIGSFLLGAIIALSFNKNIFKPESLTYLLLVTGILGAYTTFSAFNYDNLVFLLDKNYTILILNILLNVFISFTLIILSYYILTKVF